MNRQTGERADRKLIPFADRQKRRELQPFIRACEALYQTHCLQEVKDHEQEKEKRR